MRGAEIADVRGRKLGKVCLAGGAELRGGNGVVGEWKSGSWIFRDRGRAGIWAQPAISLKLPPISAAVGIQFWRTCAAALLVPLF